MSSPIAIYNPPLTWTTRVQLQWVQYSDGGTRSIFEIFKRLFANLDTSLFL